MDSVDAPHGNSTGLSARARPAGMRMLLYPPAPRRGVPLSMPAGPPHAGPFFLAAPLASNARSQHPPRPTHPCAPLRGAPSRPGAHPASRAPLRSVAAFCAAWLAIHLLASGQGNRRFPRSAGSRRSVARRAAPSGRSQIGASRLVWACVWRASGGPGRAWRGPNHAPHAPRAVPWAS